MPRRARLWAGRFALRDDSEGGRDLCLTRSVKYARPPLCVGANRVTPHRVGHPTQSHFRSGAIGGSEEVRLIIEFRKSNVRKTPIYAV